MAGNPRKMTENELHEYVAEIEGHGSQVTGVVGYFYDMYRARGDRAGAGHAEPRDPRSRLRRRHDVRGHRHRARFRWTCRCGACRFARAKGQPALCGDGYHVPFAVGSFSTVLLIAMLEHTSEPWRVLAEARRVLKPGGRAIIVVPNDVTMSAGRLVLGKFPIRYPDHLTFTTPGRMHRWLNDGFRVTEEFSLPFRPLPYAVNLYYFMVAEAA